MRAMPITVLSESGPALMGREEGLRFLQHFQTRAPRDEHPTVLALDFSGIQVATATFFREAVLGFRHHVKTTRPHYFLMVGNLSSGVREELDDYLRMTSDALYSGSFFIPMDLVNEGLLGQLNPILADTLAIVGRKEETTAADLHRESDQNIGVTAWHNRLKLLAAKSLIIEFTRGHIKRYRPLFPDGKHLAKLPTLPK